MGRISLVFDSGAVTALAKGNIEARSFVREALKSGHGVVLPSVVVAETTRGTPRDAPIDRVIKHATVVALDLKLARMAGRLLHGARSKQTIDAIIVATADLAPGSAILTGDERDITALANVERMTAVLPI